MKFWQALLLVDILGTVHGGENVGVGRYLHSFLNYSFHDHLKTIEYRASDIHQLSRDADSYRMYIKYYKNKKTTKYR